MDIKLKRKIIKYMIRAIKKYNMIEPNDTIAVGVSGGKDSLALLDCLATIKSYNKIPFNLIAITINQGIPEENYKEMEEFIKDFNIPHYNYKTDIFEIIFDVRKEKNPCSLCAKMRRGALCEKAKELGANKIALGHHADDMIETFLLSFIYEGRLSTFMPSTHMSRTNITCIRPMIYVPEKDISILSKDYPIVKNPCPADKHSNRQYVKDIVRSIKQKVKISETNMLNAITHPERYNLLDKLEDGYYLDNETQE